MSVLAINRKESKYEAIDFSQTLRDKVLSLTQRNYGIKDIYHFVRKRYAFGKDKTENFEKYIYLMQNSKKKVDMLTKSLIGNLIAAQIIHPTIIDELNERRKFLNFAIVNCNICLQL